MPDTPPFHVLFVAAAGPRVGFGHLVRCGVLASALGVRPRIVLRASGSTRRAARALGWHVSRPMPSVLRGLATDLVIVDDPSTAEVAAWVRRARGARLPVVAIRDLGADGAGADLVIDGTFVPESSDLAPELRGPAYALLDPVIAVLRDQRLARHPHRALVALGGGTYVRQLGVDLARRIRHLSADLHVDLAPGFAPGRLPALPAGCRWIERHAVRRALATTGVAVVAGGITLFEALALGTPTVTLALNDGQLVTTRQASALGIVADAGPVTGGHATAMAAALAVQLAGAPALADALGAHAQGFVDGRGAARAVRAIASLMADRLDMRRRHAA